jgi:hypothetical protein
MSTTPNYRAAPVVEMAKQPMGDWSDAITLVIK